MNASIRSLCAALLCALGLPVAAFAQATIAGAVRDTSGALLPGVTVEAASPALIEKARTVVSDGAGQYQIVDLRPGTYTVTFTLPGFNTVKREGIELSGSFVASINIEMRVGALEETVTVTGESPVVDVQSVAQQKVLGQDVIEAIPSSRTQFSIAALLPAMQSNASRGGTDVGGTNAIAHVFLTSHGGRQGDQRIMIDGLPVNNAEGSGQYPGGFLPNMGSTQELSVNYAAGAADQATGGVMVNLIPRDGGNLFRGSFYANGTGGNVLQASNITQALKDRGLATPNAIKRIWDINPGYGGPILRDRLWFYASARWNRADIYGGGFQNLNAGNPDAWTYLPDTSKPTVNETVQRSYNGRVTWQASQRQKFSLYYDHQYRCWCPRDLTSTTSPEAVTSADYPIERVTSGTWSSPLTSRLLLDAGAMYHDERWTYRQPADRAQLAMIGVVEQSTGRLYRGQTTTNGGGLFPDSRGRVTSLRGALSYVTGTHNFKTGIAQQRVSRSLDVRDNDFNLSYRFNNGVPNQLTQRSTPIQTRSVANDLGVYAQDKWTLDRLTLNLGVRFDYFGDYFPEQRLGPSQYVPNRNITFPKMSWVSWTDVTPRLGAAYDLFGNGRTALKITLNKYMLAFGLGGIFGDGSNPVQRVSNTVTRSWNDANRNFTPDCSLVDPLANGECGIMSNVNFGQPLPSTTVDPDTLTGWGKRGYNWEFSTGVTHELLPRLAVDFGYFRRWYGNFTVTDNRAVAPSDYTTFSITAPADSRLPGGGGYTIGGLYDLNPSRQGQVDNYFTFAGNYGKQIEHWNGVDIGLSARLQSGVILQGGISTGRTVTDNCEVVQKLDNPSTRFCHSETSFLTQVKGFGAYTVPRIDVQISATLQSLPGPAILANYNAPNALVQPSLGRPLSGGAANVTVNLVEPGTMYGERTTQLDLRIGRVLAFGRTRASVSVDLFNALNANPVQQLNNNFASWQQPQSILQARIAKFGVQIDF